MLKEEEQKNAEKVDRRIRDRVDKFPTTVASSVFEDPGFQKKMNSWMIGTHITWGITLAMAFIGLNYTLIWLQPPPWLVSLTFGPLGVGYLSWQWWKYRRKSGVPRGTNERGTLS